jgi:hypothetical protein
MEPPPESPELVLSGGNTAESEEPRTAAHLPRTPVYYSAADVVEPYWKWLRWVAREHPALLFTLGYLFLAAVGITYDFWLYRAFGVDILDYAEVSDFLLAAVREPMVVLLSVLSVGFILGLQEFHFRMWRRFAWYRAWHGTRYRWQSRLNENVVWVRITLTGLAVWYFFGLFAPGYAARVARAVAQGKGRRVAVRLDSSPQQAAEFELIGTTTRFVIVFDREQKVARIFPLDGVAEITVVPPPDKPEEKPGAPAPDGL